MYVIFLLEITLLAHTSLIIRIFPIRKKKDHTVTLFLNDSFLKPMALHPDLCCSAGFVVCGRGWGGGEKAVHLT